MSRSLQASSVPAASVAMVSGCLLCIGKGSGHERLPVFSHSQENRERDMGQGEGEKKTKAIKWEHVVQSIHWKFLAWVSLGMLATYGACSWRGLDPRAALQWASLTWLHLAHAHTAQFAEILVFKPLCVSNIFKTRSKLFGRLEKTR